MERPALKQMLGHVQSGAVDVVVVYKVDRLTRSLSDFAKIVEVFDKAGASFVSVTQQFNTTTSMGRLTLNVLLSFALAAGSILAACTHAVRLDPHPANEAGKCSATRGHQHCRV